jgi:hypothetical protein
MAKILAITDKNGKLLGVQRADPIDVGHGMTVQAVPDPRSPHNYRYLDVPDNLIGKPGRGVETLHNEVRRLLGS